MKMFSVEWFISTFINVFITMVFIYIIKKVAIKYHIPVIEPIAQSV
jgi:uncharacterized membrane protein